MLNISFLMMSNTFKFILSFSLFTENFYLIKVYSLKEELVSVNNELVQFQIILTLEKDS